MRSPIAVAVAALLLTVAAAGCGSGGTTGTGPTTGSGAIATGQAPGETTTVPSGTKSTPADSSLARALQNRAKDVQACQQRSGGDPHKLASCLGAKHLISKSLAGCLGRSRTRSDVEACIRRAAGS